MNPVIVRGVKIGEGTPKICVPIVGVTKEEIIKEAKSFGNLPVDVAEWRCDWYEDIFDIEKMKEVLADLREALGDIPLLFTFRSSKEGGEKEIGAADYSALNKQAAQSGYVDLIDVEAYTGDEIVRDIIASAHACGVKVVASNHEFNRTPAKEEIIRRLCKMQELGGDIPKIAVMPQNKKDVLTLLAATEEMVRVYADCPVITMSMAGTGVISRLCGEVFGSALTFGAATKASAPGQMGVEDLHAVLGMIHKSL